MTAPDTPSRPDAAIENLTSHQVQCDTDGTMIQVSRQALDEVLAYLAAKPADDGVRIPYDAEARLGYVWLIWGLTTDRIDLIAVATTEEACARYLEAGKLMNRYRAVKDEKAFVDHLYGGGLLKAITNARLPLSTKAKP